MDQEFASESKGRESFHPAVNEEVTVKSFEAESVSGSQNQRTLEVIVATDSAGWNTTTDRLLAFHLARDPRFRLRAFVPRNTWKWSELASNIELLEDDNLPGISPIELLQYPPDKLQNIDFLIMHSHGRELGEQAEKICKAKKCRWIHVVHEDWGEFLKFFEEEGVSLIGHDPDHRAERQRQIELCKKADLVVTIGSKIAESFKNALQSCGKDTNVISIVPGIVSGLNKMPKQNTDGEPFYVLFGAEYPFLAPYFKVRGCDLAVKAITFLQDGSYHIIFASKLCDGDAKLTRDLLHAGLQLNQFTIKSIPDDSAESFASVTAVCDLLVLPSRVEAFGMSGLYAISANLPVLVSGNSGLGVALKKLPSGGKHVVDSEDPLVWADKIKEVREKSHKTVYQEAKQLREEYMKTFCWEDQCNKLVEKMMIKNPQNDSTVPLEIRARGPRAERAFQKALQNGKVKVYRGRIMLLGQDRAGKTSLKKSLLGMPFNPKEESTVGVEVDPSKCEVDVDQVKNWEPTERKKLEVTEFVEDIAKLIARDLNESAAEQENVPSAAPSLEQKNSDQVDAGSANNSEASPTVPETTPNENYDSGAEIDRTSDNISENSGHTLRVIQLNIDTTEVLPEDVTDLVLQYLQNLKLEADIKAKEVILTLWDFAGQHLYYASHSVFLSARAVYILVYNLSKTLNAEAEPCVRQGIHDIVLDNPNSETNLDNLMSWLVSVHSIRRPTADETGRDNDSQGVNLRYLRPPVFIVGTNADQPCEDVKKIENCIKRSISGKTYEKHLIRPFFAVDNTKSQKDGGVQALQKRILEVLKEEPYMGEEVPLRWFKFEKVVEALVARRICHMDLDQLLKVIIQECRIDDKDELTAMLNFYHDLGVIVKHGRTVVLQAQWLIDLFKQLITVKPFDELNPLYSDCWHDLEESGVLGMALVDHVFADFVQKGLHKQDILDMMELYGLIAKFSCSSAESEQEQTYFVPSQLRSSPSGLCEIKPSETDPCPLYLHFLDGFVPHGLFPQLLSRCIGWCSEQGLTQAPQLFNNGARLFMGMQTIFDLILICRKRFLKVILKRNLASAKPPSIAASVKMAGEVRAFIEATLQGLARDLSWLHNLRYELCVACSHCLQSSGQNTKQKSSCQTDDDCLHLLRVPAEALICPKSFCDETIKVHGLDKWFPVRSSEIEEQKVELLVAEGVPAPFDQPVSPKSGKPSSDDLLLVAFELGTSWKMLGRALGLPEPVLEQIEEDEHNLFDKCFRRSYTKARDCSGVLRKWTEAFGTAATYPSLARALRHRIVGRPKLAAKYCGVHRDTSGEEVSSSIPCQTSDASNLSFPVFLSYQWDLQDTVKTLKNKIEARGIQCWMDIGEMGGGDALFSRIDAGIRACKVFVCCVTEKYIQSDMCQREATLADRLKKPIIPLLFEEISWPPEGQLSLIFARLLYIRISDTRSTIHDSELDQLMKKVQQFMENPKSV